MLRPPRSRSATTSSIPLTVLRSYQLEMPARSKKPSRRAQTALFQFIQKAAERRENLLDLTEIAETSKREADEANEQLAKAEQEYNNMIQEREAEYIAKGDTEGLEWFRRMRAELDQIDELEQTKKESEAENVRLRNEIARLEEEAERLKSIRGET
ncbi:unnamed protein product [Rhizoctonia solani]|uniref:Uncharacterized protein n=1 Tax=Rhizoctonia solani TaxID=456999 RepID=A0A8H3A5M1_9AGAM|nr:unnamed protein product [Rhizoctonia solani]